LLALAFFENFQPNERVFKFQQFLFCQIVDRQNFGNPVADPIRIVVLMRFGNPFIPQIPDDALKQRQQAFALRWQRYRHGFGEKFYRGLKQVARAGFGLHDAKASPALGRDHQDAELFHLPVDDFASVPTMCGSAASPVSPPLAIRQMPKGFALLHADGGHVEVALLENFQWQARCRGKARY
jgi:hypothetical protein